jgi:hypothetical protein
MAFDYSTAPEQRGFDLVPDGTVATLQLEIRPGGAGDGGLLKRSKDGGCEMLDAQFVVVDGVHVKRKLWENLIVAGTTSGHAQAADISRGKLRAMIESARGIKPDDTSPEARAARTVELADFNGLRFIARIGVEKGRPKNDGSGESYADRNTIAAVITPDRKDWHKVEQAPRPADLSVGGAPTASTPAPVASISKPSWAT